MPHKRGPVRGRVACEALDLLILLGVSLYHFNSINRFGQVGIHNAEGLTRVLRYRAELLQIGPDGHHIRDGKKNRDRDQGGIDGGGDYQRKQNKVGGADNQIETRVEHQTDLTYVVRRACHRLSDGLQVVEGHAFTQ